MYGSGLGLVIWDYACEFLIDCLQSGGYDMLADS